MPNIESPRQELKLGLTTLSGGAHLPEVEVAFEQYGELSSYGDNAILVCHALTGSARAAGENGWWDPVIGPEAALDTDRYAVFCANILGSCYGTSGPLSIDPLTGRPYGPHFPHVSVGDMVAVQRQLMAALGVKSLVTVAGGSLGGLQVLEWAVQAPEMVRSIAPIGCSLSHSPWAIAFNETARQAIRVDPNWHAGDYASHGVSPDDGLALARMVAMISYRSCESFEDRFGRRERLGDEDGTGRYEIESYLHYQGEKLVQRFDANCYMRITEAMDSFDVGQGRGGAAKALAPFRGPALVMGIETDILYPVHQQQEIAATLEANGNDVTFDLIRSIHGHDAFLMEWDQLDTALRAFLPA